MNDRTVHGPSIAPAGILLGIGLGGFLDGILLHQTLQAHNMLSAVIPVDSMAGMKTNMLADGLFHADTWTATVAGVALLWSVLNCRRDMSASGASFVGYMLAGWGWFNLVEGIIDCGHSTADALPRRGTPQRVQRRCASSPEPSSLPLTTLP